MKPRVSRDVDSTRPGTKGLTMPLQNVNVKPIRGDQEFMKEIQPHLNAGLWPVYLAQADARWEDPPSDGREEAPGARPE